MTQEPEFLTALVDALGDIIVIVDEQLETRIVEDVVFEEVEVRVQEEVDLCTYQLPDPPPDKELLLSEVKAIYYPGGGTQGQDIYRTTDTTVPCSIGWQFDDPTNPTLIEFCTETCAMIQADAAAKVEIEIGCYEIG